MKCERLKERLHIKNNSKSLKAYYDCDKLKAKGRFIMQKDKIAGLKKIMSSLDIDQAIALKSLIEPSVKEKASKLSEKQRLEKLAHHDNEIASLRERLTIVQRQRSRLAHDLGITEIVKASRNAVKVWSFSFSHNTKALKLSIKKEGSKRKAFHCTIPIARINKRKVVTKEERKKAFEKLAIHYGVDIASKAYNNISTNNWLKQIEAFCSQAGIHCERKNML
jgi:hypothetical protein